MKKLKCHCGKIEAEINIKKIEKTIEAVIAPFAKERSYNVYG